MFSVLLLQIITSFLISLTYQHQFGISTSIWNSSVKYTKYVLNLEDYFIFVYFKAHRWKHCPYMNACKYIFLVYILLYKYGTCNSVHVNFLWPETESNYLIYTSIYLCNGNISPQLFIPYQKTKTMKLYEVPVFNLYHHFKLWSII